jgi:hypothetical protein
MFSPAVYLEEVASGEAKKKQIPPVAADSE